MTFNSRIQLMLQQEQIILCSNIYERIENICTNLKLKQNNNIFSSFCILSQGVFINNSQSKTNVCSNITNTPRKSTRTLKNNLRFFDGIEESLCFWCDTYPYIVNPFLFLFCVFSDSFGQLQ